MNNVCIAQLLSVLQPEQLLTDSACLISYSYDNGRHHALPIAVALPNCSEQVQAIVQICIEHNIPITARGRGSGTPGGAVPSTQALVISFERMDKILHFCPESRYMIVEPGVLNQSVQNLAGSKNLMWGPDPSSQAYCSVGGNLAYNAGGPHTLKYGATRDNVLYVEAITGCGELIKTGFAVTKSASGYDLTRLLIGSEGTLALFTKACLKLTAKPEAKTLLQAWFRNEAQACEAVASIMNQAVTPAALEFMDKNCLALLRTHSTLKIPAEAEALLLIEIDGFKNELAFYVSHLQQLLNNGLQVTEAQDPDQAWAARKALSPILRQLAPYKINEDVVVPIDQLNHLLNFLSDITAEMNILNVNFGHAGNGNLHVNLLLQHQDEIPHAEKCLEKIFAKVIELGGAPSGEHGIGLDKKPYLTKAYSANTLAMMRAIKRQFDPHNILNPDKLLPLE